MVDSQLFAWMRILVVYIRADWPDLTNTQIAVLLICYMTPGPHSAADLALRLRVTKSVVSRSLSRLVALGYLRQKRNPEERRKADILHTDEGIAFLAELKRSLRIYEPGATAAAEPEDGTDLSHDGLNLDQI